MLGMRGTAAWRRPDPKMYRERGQAEWNWRILPRRQGNVYKRGVVDIEAE